MHTWYSKGVVYLEYRCTACNAATSQSLLAAPHYSHKATWAISSRTSRLTSAPDSGDVVSNMYVLTFWGDIVWLIGSMVERSPPTEWFHIPKVIGKSCGFESRVGRSPRNGCECCGIFLCFFFLVCFFFPSSFPSPSPFKAGWKGSIRVWKTAVHMQKGTR